VRKTSAKSDVAQDSQLNRHWFGGFAKPMSPVVASRLGFISELTMSARSKFYGVVSSFEPRSFNANTLVQTQGVGHTQRLS
jgi:hypothetical protein